jgi:sugar (pentulose or hexulose) kinase
MNKATKGTYLAGVDIGTSGAKGMVFDLEGTALASAYREYPCTYPRPGWVEQDVELVVESTMSALAQAVRESGVRPSDIASFSLSAQRSCGIFLDERERLVRPLISWQDNRSAAEVKEIAARIDEALYYKKTGYPNSTTWLLSKMMWVRKNEPEVWKRTRRVVQMHDYFVRALGAEEYFNDYNDAGFFGFFDSSSGSWDEELLALFDIPKAFLPLPKESGTPVGKVSTAAARRCGLAAGTPIVAGAGDQSAGAVGAGIVREGLVSVSLGTAGAVTAFLPEPFRDPAGRAMVTAHPMAGRWLLEGYQAAAASVYRWYRDQLGGLEILEAQKKGDDFYNLMNAKVAAVAPGAGGLLVLPYFASAGTPRYNPSARGVVLGLTFAHDRFALARAFMEGVTLDMKDMLTAMVNSGVAVSEARLLGGPTKSRVWNQIQADVYGVPVTTLKVTDATVLGAAVLAGAGAGVFPSIAAGAERMVSLDERFEPKPENVEKYRRLYRLFCRAYEGLDSSGVFAELAALQA